MSTGYVLRPRREISAPLDASPLRPDTLGALAPGDLEKVRLTVGARSLPLGELFEIDGEPGPRLLVYGGRNLIHLGAGMASGTLEVIGDGGDLCGVGMTGGEVRVRGSVGRSAGAAMSGGLLRIDGQAGDLLGGPSPTSAKGMTGGEILVLGPVGARAGHRMRRGLIACASTAGANPGHVMIAGTLIVAEGPLLRPGLDMRRGTILSLDPAARHDLGPNFRPDTRSRPVILRLLLGRLEDLGFPVSDGRRGGLYRQWSGDRLGMGRGEIFTYLES